jgi:hypothetical protein
MVQRGKEEALAWVNGTSGRSIATRSEGKAGEKYLSAGGRVNEKARSFEDQPGRPVER